MYIFYKDFKEEITMTLLNKLEELVVEMSGTQASTYLWGEVEMPQCIKDEIEIEEE